ncbi:MAG: glycosyltransferase [Okeania sp. SIO2D1]|nr:glycosyltransferase [Okeania sp. SIO2D1]
MGQLNILVTPKFIKSHPTVVEAASGNQESSIKFSTITSEEESQLESQETSKGRLVRTFQEWKILRKYVKQLNPTHCLFMYFDSILLSIAILKKLPCPCSGIYFRPIFHYGNFSSFQPSFKEQILQKRDQFVLSRLLSNEKLHTLFSLDLFAAEHINKLNTSVKSVYLPDPVQIYQDNDFQPDKLKQEVGIESGRKVFLLFGVPQKRKGIYQLLDALQYLTNEDCQQLCILIVGPKSADEHLHQKIAELDSSTPVQFIKQERFVPDQEIQPYFQISDLVLALYQHHIGMSAILVRAAAASKPVLSCNYGLMGEIVKMYQLGITVEATIPSQIAAGMTKILSQSQNDLCNFEKMSLFAEQNSAENFATTIFQHLKLNSQN